MGKFSDIILQQNHFVYRLLSVIPEVALDLVYNTLILIVFNQLMLLSNGVNKIIQSGHAIKI